MGEQMSKKIFNFSEDEIRKKKKLGVKTKDIAKKYGCCVSSIAQFCAKHDIKKDKIDLVGFKFGKFEVIKKIGSVGSGSRKRITWLCLCECGNYREYTTAAINQANVISCGCYLGSKERSRNNKLWNGYEDIHGRVWGHIKSGALRRGYKFDVTMKDAWDIFVKQNKKCALTGLDIHFSDTIRQHENGESTASLDRIDSTKGYTKDNVQWVHKKVNIMKNVYSEEEFVNLCKLVVEHKISKGMEE